MSDSLVNRVRGVFLGVLLGESLTTHKSGDLGEILVLGSESLIIWGRLNVDDWLKRYQQKFIDLEITDNAWGKILVATLPVAIFFHEDRIKLKDRLLQVLQIWDANPEVKDAAIVIGYAIANSLTQKLEPLTIIPQIISCLGENNTPVPQNLLKVQTLLEQGAGLKEAQIEFDHPEKISHNLALALYCFLSSPEDFYLTVLRANDNVNHINSSQQEPDNFGYAYTSVLAGALSGAYNSTIGIPVNWQILVSANHQSLSGAKNCSQMLELADTLVAVWSGAYNISVNSSQLTKARSKIDGELSPHTIISAPRLIRP